MTKKDYQQPTMKVVKLQHRQHLLQASGLETLQGKKGARKRLFGQLFFMQFRRKNSTKYVIK